MRQLYSVRNDRFGITFRPAKRASPSSRTELTTRLWRASPKSFKPNNDRMAHAAGTIFDPGKLLRSRTASGLADVGHITYDRTGAVGPFFIPTSGQFSEAFLL